MRLSHLFLEHLQVPIICIMVVGALSVLARTSVAQENSYGLEPGLSIPENARPYAPKFFAPLKKLTRFGLAISDDNRECYFAVAFNDNAGFREEIRFTQLGSDGNWTKPKPLLPEEKKYKYVDPHFSPDGKQLYFIYTKPLNATKAPKRPRFDIWHVQRNGKGWSEPINVGLPISTNEAEEYFVSLTSEKKMFFSSNRVDRNNFDLYSARLGKNGQYEKPQPLMGSVNTDKYEADVFVAPDESYIIYSSSGREDGRGQGDLYVSFKDSAGNWSAGKNLGDQVNSKQQEFAPAISRDQKALFFSRGGVIHWVSTSVIEKLKS